MSLAQLKQYADKHKAAASASAAGTSTSQVSPPSLSHIPRVSGRTEQMGQWSSSSTPQAQPASQPAAANPAFKHASPSPFLGSTPTTATPIPATLPTTTQGAVQWQPAQQGRPSLTGGVPSGRVAGTCALRSHVRALRTCGDDDWSVHRRAAAGREAAGRHDGACARRQPVAAEEHAGRPEHAPVDTRPGLEHRPERED